MTSKKPSLKPTTELAVVSKPQETKRTENEARVPQIGDWYWLKTSEDTDDDDDEEEKVAPEVVEKLGCIMHVGSNYVEFTAVSPNDTTWRVHENEFDQMCRHEPNPQVYLQNRIEHHQANVNKLMGEVKQLTARLGIIRGALPEGAIQEETTALAVVHGAQDVQEHKAALIKAKQETLPELFKKIEAEHKMLAMWMKGGLLPQKAKMKKLKQETEGIEDRIFTVELYAGLIEEMKKVKDGEPAGNDAKVHLFQRMHFMDEECLADYQAGGMDFRSLREFERWLCQKKHFERIFPYPRTIVAFRIRRYKKARRGETLWDFIRIRDEERLDEMTFLYIRNGAQLWRLQTGIDFGEQLFPYKEDSLLLGNKDVLYAEVSWHKVGHVVTEGHYQEIMKERKEEKKRYHEELKAWEKLTDEEKETNSRPWYSHMHDRDEYQKVDKSSVFYDDVMQKIAKEAVAHNRVVVVLQGILDRSPALHPHPPWQLWTAEGFAMGLELVYDMSHALCDGEPPSFKAFCAKLNAHLETGCFTIGQQHEWLESERDKEEQRRRNSYRYSYKDYDLTWWTPYDNPGPGKIAKVVRFTGKRECVYKWERPRQRESWKGTMITSRFACAASKVLNVSAYKPGDYHIFYDDPRTRMEYLEWAPWLLAAEDWHAGKKGLS